MSEERPRKQKRPELAIYQPGRTRLSKNPPAAAPSGQPSPGDNRPHAATGAEEDSQQKTTHRSKRPEQQRYVPKPRQSKSAAALTEKSQDNTETESQTAASTENYKDVKRKPHTSNNISDRLQTSSTENPATQSSQADNLPRKYKTFHNSRYKSAGDTETPERYDSKISTQKTTKYEHHVYEKSNTDTDTALKADYNVQMADNSVQKDEAKIDLTAGDENQNDSIKKRHPKSYKAQREARHQRDNPTQPTNELSETGTGKHAETKPHQPSEEQRKSQPASRPRGTDHYKPGRKSHDSEYRSGCRSPDQDDWSDQRSQGTAHQSGLKSRGSEYKSGQRSKNEDHKSGHRSRGVDHKSGQRSGDERMTRKVTFNEESSTATEGLKLEDLERNIKSLSLDEPARNPGRQSNKRNQKQTNPTQRSNEQSRSKKSTNNNKSTRHRKLGEDDLSRLYDPYSDGNTPASGDGRSRGGLIHLPANSTQHEQTTQQVALFNPDNPEQPINVQYSSNRANRANIDNRVQQPGGDYPQYHPFYYNPAYSSNVPFNKTGVTGPYMQEGFNRTYSIHPSLKQRSSNIITEVLSLDSQLNQMFTVTDHDTTWKQRLNRLRIAIRDKLEQLLLLDIEFCNSRQVDQLLWKSVFYNPITSLRHDYDKTDHKTDDCKQEIVIFIDEAEAFYKQLLTKYETEFEFDLSLYTHPSGEDNPPRGIFKMVILLCQRYLISLGDLCRYRVQILNTTDYAPARRYYQQSSRLAPKNGKPYNLLGIVALSVNRYLDVVYYFMRALTSPYPSHHSRDSVNDLYYHFIHKYRATKKAQVKARQVKLKQKQTNNEKRYQKNEIWISPIDGETIADCNITDEESENPDKLSSSENYKKIINTFICSIGMLFTKISMEMYYEASSELLHSYAALLEYSPIPHLDLHKLTYIFMINMLTIEYLQTTQGTSSLMYNVSEVNSRSHILEQSILLLLDLFTITVNRCTQLLINQTDITVELMDNDDLQLMLSVIKLCSDWLTCHPDLWNPAPFPRDPLLGPVLDPWHSLASLVNILIKVDTSRVKLLREGNEVELERLRLSEDVELRGFTPLLNMTQEVRYYNINHDQTLCAQTYRISKLLTLADFLCGIEPSMLEYDVPSSSYKSVVTPPLHSEETNTGQQANDSSPEHEKVLDWAEERDSSEDSADEELSPLQELRKHRDELQVELEKQRKQEQLYQNLLDQEGFIMNIEIRPTYLVPDTNCFIEYPDRMKRLISTRKFTVVVPLVVLNELDGLCKTTADKYRSDLEHAQNVQTSAQAAVEFLEAQFEERNHRLKALTQGGTEMSTIRYRSESSNNGTSNNDDRILSCCIHYIKDHARAFMPKPGESAIKLYREVALITDDRNLRLKAHSRHVPVKDLLSLMKWAKIR